MNSILKWCLILGSLLVIYPKIVQAETVAFDYKPEALSYNQNGIDMHFQNNEDVLKPKMLIAAIETDKMAVYKSQTNGENAKLKAEIATLRRELADSKYLHALSKRSLKKFKDTSAEFTELEAKYNETAEILTKQNKKVNELEDEVANLMRQNNIMWFFSGVGVFLLGFLIGYSARREKRKSLL